MAKKQKYDEIVKKYVELLQSLGAGDPEAAHVKADSYLLNALDELGAGDIADAFEACEERIGFMYA